MIWEDILLFIECSGCGLGLEEEYWSASDEMCCVMLESGCDCPFKNSA
jgi:hypothetical protein